MGQPCDACRKYAVHTLGTDPDKMVCVYPCAPAELAKRRASYDDRLLAKQVEEQLEGPQKRRTRSATALETSLDAGECVQVVPERVAEGAEGSPSSVEVKKVKLAKVKQPKVAPEVVKRPEAQVNTSISMHPMSLEAATASGESVSATSASAPS